MTVLELLTVRTCPRGRYVNRPPMRQFYRCDCDGNLDRDGCRIVFYDPLRYYIDENGIYRLLLAILERDRKDEKRQISE